MGHYKFYVSLSLARELVPEELSKRHPDNSSILQQIRMSLFSQIFYKWSLSFTICALHYKSVILLHRWICFAEFSMYLKSDLLQILRHLADLISFPYDLFLYIFSVSRFNEFISDTLNIFFHWLNSLFKRFMNYLFFYTFLLYRYGSSCQDQHVDYDSFLVFTYRWKVSRLSLRLTSSVLCRIMFILLELLLTDIDLNLTLQTPSCTRGAALLDLLFLEVAIVLLDTIVVIVPSYRSIGGASILRVKDSYITSYAKSLVIHLSSVFVEELPAISIVSFTILVLKSPVFRSSATGLMIVCQLIRGKMHICTTILQGSS